MDELALRLLVVTVIGALAVLMAFMSRRGRSLRRRTFEPRGIGPGLHLFTSASCSSCDRARAALAESGRSFTEHSYERNAQVLEENRIERVPAVAHVPDGDGSAWLAEGVPSVRSLARWLGP